MEKYNNDNFLLSDIEKKLKSYKLNMLTEENDLLVKSLKRPGGLNKEK